MKFGKKKKEIEIKKSWWQKIIEERSSACVRKRERAYDDYNEAVKEGLAILEESKISILLGEIKKIISKVEHYAWTRGHTANSRALSDALRQDERCHKQIDEIIEEIKKLAKGDLV